MRIQIIRACAAATGVALLAMSAVARAQQTDTNPPPPNVLILLDNSGSMERMIDNNLPENDGNTCNYEPVLGAQLPLVNQPQANRWGVLVQALTGTFQSGYNCISMPRTTGSNFANEYQIGGVAPYDTNYYLNYHRPVMLDKSTVPPTACVVAPGALPGANPGQGVGPTGAGSGNRGPGAGALASDLPPDGIILRPYNQLTVTSNPTIGPCSQFASKQFTNYQYQDGAIPSSSSLMRFGLMTFDEDPGGAIGVTTGSTPTVVGAGYSDPNSTSFGAFAGMWSYFPGWSTGASCPYLGNPVDCQTNTTFAVGARNPAAPPWEGRMMRFPSTNDLLTQQTNNQNVANVVLATRPYGATPLAGMLQDAEYYLWNDPTGPEQTDSFVHCGQRPQYIIILTDGAPNLDMRPDCANGSSGIDAAPRAGNCPFALPETVAQTLFTGGSNVHSVTTFVLGFAVSTVTDPAGSGQTSQCSSLVNNGLLSSKCDFTINKDPVSQALYAPCCELQRIALAGSNHQTPAFFADSPGALQAALNTILAQIGSHATTRTTPSYSPSSPSVLSSPSSPTTVGSVYLASFQPSPGLPWTGDVLRQRQQCTQSAGKYTGSTSNVDPTVGDDFGQNLNSNTGPPRRFIALQPDPITGGSTVDASATIRPYVTTTVGDGLGKYSATAMAGPAANVIPNITPAALAINGSCAYTSSTTHAPVSPGLTASSCAQMVLDYTFAQSGFSANPGDFPFVTRYGRALGDIYHAAPAVVGPPGALLQEASYAGFQSTWQTRQTAVYVATNDGLLHAFWADEGKLENNELWAMLPPAVMPNLYSSYPASHELLLDGSPVVKDVAWDRTIATSGDPTVWHTMLVAGYGATNQGYYAVDVTNPDASKLPTGSVPVEPPVPGPVFRWQLTKMPAKNYPIFGAHSATPAIATLYMDPNDGNGRREIGVAILPGGADGAPTSSAGLGPSCARLPKASDSAPPSGYSYRANVRCWGSTQKSTDPVNGRSLAVVRIDTGEILQVFARKADVQNYPTDTLLAAGRIRDTPLDSPMTGTPLVYPNDVGSDTTKVFVADADGTMWKFDLSSPDPTQWTGELYLDFYNQTVDTNATSWSDGQPLQVPPSLSLDTSGELVINAASGTTDSFDSSGVDFLYSITEKVQGATPKLRAFVNWYLGNPLTATTSTPPPTPQVNLPVAPLLPGERVSGPMTVFDGTLYFSTYAATPTPPPGQPVTSCQPSVARVWGLDFVTPNSQVCPDPTSSMCVRSQGGNFKLIPNATWTQPPVANVTPYATDPTLASAVIPGLSIQVTPACASAGTPGTDQYVPGATHSAPSNFTPGSFSIFTQVGASNTTGGGAAQLSIPVATPVSPTTIDSWAAVLE
jgi:type IV pilus assembly protein PilY1